MKPSTKHSDKSFNVLEDLLTHLRKLPEWNKLIDGFRNPIFLNVGKLVSLEEGENAIVFGDPENVARDIMEMFAIAEINTGEPHLRHIPIRSKIEFHRSGICDFFFAFQDIILDAKDDDMEKKLVKHWFSGLVHEINYWIRYDEDRVDLAIRMMCLGDGSAPLYGNGFHHLVSRTVNFDTTKIATPEMLEILHRYQPLLRQMQDELRLATIDRDRLLDWFASVILTTMKTYGESENGRLIIFGNIEGIDHVSKLPEYADILEKTRSRLQLEAEIRSAEKLIWEEKIQEDKRRAAEQDAIRSANRLARVGKSQREAASARNMSWRAMTPEKMKDLIWKHPTTTLAVMLGVSDVAIAKYCKKHDLEKPPRGYWAKLHGEKTPASFSQISMQYESENPSAKTDVDALDFEI